MFLECGVDFFHSLFCSNPLTFAFSTVESVEEIICLDLCPDTMSAKVRNKKYISFSTLARILWLGVAWSKFFSIRSNGLKRSFTFPIRLQPSPPMEVTGLKETVVRLESSLTEKQNEILFLEEEVRSLRMKLTKRDAELIKQERELNKLRVKEQINWLFHPS